MRFISLLLLILCLAACQHAPQNNEAVRQGVIDHLTTQGLNVAAMDITIASVKFDGKKATVAFTTTVKGAPGGMPMSFNYNMEEKDNKWVFVSRAGGGHADEAAPAAAPGGANPHGAGGIPTTPPGGASQMPLPNDLPPATKKK